MKLTLADAIQSLKPGAEFSYENEDYSTIKWDILEGEAPTEKQLQDELLKLEAKSVKEAVDNAKAKAALLERLGITADEAALLLR